MYHFSVTLKRDSSVADLIEIMCNATEYAIFPVRHSEDKANQELAASLDYKTSVPMDSPHLKVLLLIYAYLSDLELPTREYVVDTKSVLDQALRILQGMLDIVTNSGWLSCTLRIVTILQMILQGQWIADSCLTMLPHVKKDSVAVLYDALMKQFSNVHKGFTLAILKELHNENAVKMKEVFAGVMGMSGAQDIDKFLSGLPIISLSLKTAEDDSSDAEQSISLTNSKMYKFKADSFVEFRFQLNRKGSSSLEVHSNKFTKVKEESWVLIVGLPEDDVLMASKKLSFKKQKTANMKLKLPSRKGLFLFVEKKNLLLFVFCLLGDYMLSLYLLSDSYIGLDQQYLVNMTVV